MSKQSYDWHLTNWQLSVRNWLRGTGSIWLLSLNVINLDWDLLHSLSQNLSSFSLRCTDRQKEFFSDLNLAPILCLLGPMINNLQSLGNTKFACKIWEFLPKRKTFKTWCINDEGQFPNFLFVRGFMTKWNLKPSPCHVVTFFVIIKLGKITFLI